MEIMHAIVLAIVQGITEFLPISSSAHLILVPELLGWAESGLVFDVAVHVGTLVAVVAFLRKEISQIVPAWFKGFGGFNWSNDGMLGWMVIFATIPVGLVGLAAGDFIEAHLRTALVIGLTTLIFGILLGVADRHAHNNQKKIENLTMTHALTVGAAQALALLPGTSRSGITMAALLGLGYDRVSAAKFSFMLAVPAIALPGLLKTAELSQEASSVDWIVLAVATAVSAITAFLCMRWFMAFVTRVGMMPFVIYRLFLAAVIFVLLV